MLHHPHLEKVVGGVHHVFWCVPLLLEIREAVNCRAKVGCLAHRQQDDLEITCGDDGRVDEMESNAASASPNKHGKQVHLGRIDSPQFYSSISIDIPGRNC